MELPEEQSQRIRIINNVNNRNENCIFGLVNKQIINKIFVYGCELKQNIYGDYFIHVLIRENNFNLLFSTLSINNVMINLKNSHKETPVILAAKLKLTKIVNYLYKSGCSMVETDYFNNSCYHYIALNGLKVNFTINSTINYYNHSSIDYLINKIIE